MLLIKVISCKVIGNIGGRGVNYTKCINAIENLILYYIIQILRISYINKQIVSGALSSKMLQ